MSATIGDRRRSGDGHELTVLEAIHHEIKQHRAMGDGLLPDRIRICADAFLGSVVTVPCIVTEQHPDGSTSARLAYEIRVHPQDWVAVETYAILHGTDLPVTEVWGVGVMSWDQS